MQIGHVYVGLDRFQSQRGLAGSRKSEGGQRRQVFEGSPRRLPDHNARLPFARLYPAATLPDALTSTVNGECGPALLATEDEHRTWLAGTADEAYALIKRSDPNGMRTVQPGFAEEEICGGWGAGPGLGTRTAIRTKREQNSHGAGSDGQPGGTARAGRRGRPRMAMVARHAQHHGARARGEW